MTKQHKAPSSLPMPAKASSYDIGYGKPPASTRFRPGQSGNPHGRPRGAQNKLPALNEERLKKIVLGEAYRTIPSYDSGKKATISMAEAVMRSIAVNAAKGDLRSQRLFIDLVNTTERSNKEIHNQYLQTMIEYKIAWEETLEHRRQRGITAPDPLPHPDDIIIDITTGDVHIKGPFTKEEKADWDRQIELLEEIKKDINEHEQLLDNEELSPFHDIIKQGISREKEICDMITTKIGDAPYTLRARQRNRIN
jgi:hypothetical protein